MAGIIVVMLFLGGGFLDRPAAAPTPSATVTFPPTGLADKAHADDLGAYIYRALGLPAPDQNRTVHTPFVAPGYEGASISCCLRAWGGRSTPVVNMTDVLFATFGIWPQLDVAYSGSEQFLQASLMGFFPDDLNSTDLPTLYERAESVAARLGLTTYAHDRTSWASTSAVSVNGEPEIVSTTVISLHAGYAGLPIAFGNELQMTFDMVHGGAVNLLVFPWFSSPAPTVTPEEAFAAALAQLNNTVEGFEGPAWFDGGVVYFAFDAVRYSLVYQVEAMYATYGRLPSGERPVIDTPYRLWVDAYDGTIVSSIEIPPHPWPSSSETLASPQPPSASPRTLILIAGLAATAGVAVLLYLARRRGRRGVGDDGTAT